MNPSEKKSTVSGKSLEKELPAEQQNSPRKLLIKLAGSAVALYLLATQIDVAGAFNHLKQISPAHFLFAFIVFNLSQWVSSVRLNIFFGQTGLQLSQKFNLKLYYVGMFYNLIVPGGIGGDAYKGYLLAKHKNASVRSLVSSMLSDRLSGLLAIMGIASLLAWITNLDAYNIPWTIIIFIVFVVSTAIYWKVFPGFRSVIPQTLTLSLLVQALQMVCIAILLWGGEISSAYPQYLLIFLASSVATVIPVTLGGLGLRELVFLYGAGFFGLNPEVAVSFSLSFFIITAISSIAGLYIHTTLKDADYEPASE